MFHQPTSISPGRKRSCTYKLRWFTVHSGLPNPNLKNQGFYNKKQKLFRRNFLLDQKKNHETFFKSSRASKWLLVDLNQHLTRLVVLEILYLLSMLMLIRMVLRNGCLVMMTSLIFQ